MRSRAHEGCVMPPKPNSSRSCPRSAHRFFALVCYILLALLIPLPIARAVEAPPLGPLTYIQTNGPNSNIALGDWYTNTANGGVPGYHYLKINIRAAGRQLRPSMLICSARR